MLKATKENGGSETSSSCEDHHVKEYWTEVTKRYERSGYDLEEHPSFILRKAHQKATSIFSELFADTGITTTQLATLSVLLKYGSISQNQLGRLAAMDPSTISVVVRKLVKCGYATSSVSDTDQRLSVISLTREGAEFALARLAHSNEVGRRLLDPLSHAEGLLLLELLKRLNG